MALGATHLSVSVLGLDVIGKGLGLLELGRVVVVVVILGADVVHLVDAAALGASLDGALAGELSRVTMSVRKSTSIRPGGSEDLRRASERCESRRGNRCNQRTAPRRRIGR